MGGGSFNDAATRTAYESFKTSTVGRSTEHIYSSSSMHANLNPFGVKIRESRDSVDNPNSTPLIVALDVTGSMGILADVIAREGLGTLFTGILDRKPISDPHVMFMAVGDVAAGDRAPLQVSQFEADKRIIEQLTQIYLEHGGGGNQFESYNLPWYFAAMHTVHDSMEKRGKRGYLFTVGDEPPPISLSPAHIKLVTGDDTQSALSSKELLEMAQRTYDVFHIVIEEGDWPRRHGIDNVMRPWTELLGQHVIRLADHRKLAETIVSAIEVVEGADAADSARGWGHGADVVHAAVQNLPKGRHVGLLGHSA